MNVWADLHWRDRLEGLFFLLYYYMVLTIAALYRIMLTTAITKTDSALTTVEAKPAKARELH